MKSFSKWWSHCDTSWTPACLRKYSSKYWNVLLVPPHGKASMLLFPFIRALNIFVVVGSISIRPRTSMSRNKACKESIFFATINAVDWTTADHPPDTNHQRDIWLFDLTSYKSNSFIIFSASTLSCKEVQGEIFEEADHWICEIFQTGSKQTDQSWAERSGLHRKSTGVCGQNLGI